MLCHSPFQVLPREPSNLNDKEEESVQKKGPYHSTCQVRERIVAWKDDKNVHR